MIQVPSEIETFETTEECKVAIIDSISQASGVILVITGSSISRDYAASLLATLKIAESKIISCQDNDLNRVNQLEEVIRKCSITVILAIGGGTVGDLGKRLGLLTNLPLYLVPTVIANDGLISPISVLSSKGISISLPGRMPDKVFIDFSILRTAPIKFIRAAALDILSNISATNDWKISTPSSLAQNENMAFRLARMAADMLLDCNDWSYYSPVFNRVVLDAQILSGFAMCYAGSSRPCSGSEHLLGHAINQSYRKPTYLHGEIVGITSRFCLFLQDYYDPRVENFFNFHQVDREIPMLKSASHDEFHVMLKVARTVRPGRNTILDRYTDMQLIEKYNVYSRNF